jgi:hypothetical protein
VAPAGSGSWSPASDRLARAVFFSCLAYFVYVAQLGWHGSLVEDQGFRQTQTAITAHYMVGQRPKLAYETPVLGPPWSIPFEFPLYQWMVAGLVTVLGTPLEQTGRAVSVAFFLLTLVPAGSVLRALGLARPERQITLSLLLVSPFYAYWSRAFLIESTALFFATAYLALAIGYLQTPRAGRAVLTALAGGLAALVKVTTFAPFLLAVGACGVGMVASDCRRGRVPWRLGRWAAHLLLHVAVPVALAAWWTHFADARKEQNRVARHQTSHALRAWNFGTWEERRDAGEWGLILSRCGLLVGHPGCLAVAGAGLLAGGRRRPVAGALLLGAAGPLIFMNLHARHEYYTYANGLFVVAAAGIALAGLRERGGAGRRLAGVGFAVTFAACVSCYHQVYYPKQTARSTGRWLSEVTRAVRESTRRGEVIVVVGFDWSSEVPYFSQRRALMIPDWQLRSFVADPCAFLEELRGYRRGALLVYHAARWPVEPGAMRRIIDAGGWDPCGRPIYGGAFAVYPLKAENEPGAGEHFGAAPPLPGDDVGQPVSHGRGA